MAGTTEQRYDAQLASEDNNRRAAMHYRNAAKSYWLDGMKHEAGIALRMAQTIEIEMQNGKEGNNANKG